MRITTVPCLSDNYAYLVICESSNQAVVVDPSQAAPVLAAVEREGVELRGIWNTHHHWDHTGGNEELLAAKPSLRVVGHVSDKGRIPGQTELVDDGDEVAVGDIKASIIYNPGHTSGAISYHIHDAGEQGMVFTGDTLFGAGCGRLFEGTAQEMHSSLSRLAALPEKTAVYCGHEYTANNLRFAAAVEPGNADVTARAAEVAKKREAGESTVPFTIAEERATNPFLRVANPAVADAARKNDDADAATPEAIFGALRRWKDRF